MNSLKEFYETPEAEEIRFTSVDAIAISLDTDIEDKVDDGNLGWKGDGF